MIINDNLRWQDGRLLSECKRQQNKTKQRLKTTTKQKLLLLRVCVCVCRLYGTKCQGCVQSIPAHELVMRAAGCVYHLPCFTCIACGQRLQKGDEFVVKDGQLFCRLDFEKEFTLMPLSPKSELLGGRIARCFFGLNQIVFLPNSELRGRRIARCFFGLNQIVFLPNSELLGCRIAFFGLNQIVFLHRSHKFNE